jgi:thiol-disulfide isomerase/thioredoxin
MRLTPALLSATLLLAGCGRLAPVPTGKAQLSLAAKGVAGAEAALKRAATKGEAGTHLPVGTQAPAMVMSRLDGSEDQLASYKGKPVLLAFWGTRCPTCTTELPHLEAMHADLASQGLNLLCVNASREKLTNLQDYWAWKLYSMPVFGQFTGAPIEVFKVNNIPTLYWIDRAGTIVDVQVGPAEPADLRARTAKLLAGK